MHRVEAVLSRDRLVALMCSRHYAGCTLGRNAGNVRHEEVSVKAREGLGPPRRAWNVWVCGGRGHGDPRLFPPRLHEDLTPSGLEAQRRTACRQRLLSIPHNSPTFPDSHTRLPPASSPPGEESNSTTRRETESAPHEEKRPTRRVSEHLPKFGSSYKLAPNI